MRRAPHSVKGKSVPSEEEQQGGLARKKKHPGLFPPEPAGLSPANGCGFRPGRRRAPLWGQAKISGELAQIEIRQAMRPFPGARG